MYVIKEGMSEISFAVISSGSKGNCTLIWDKNDLIMIDFGITLKRFRESVSPFGIEDKRTSLFVSHEHTDHMAGIKILAKHADLDVYSRKKTLDAISIRDSFEIGRSCTIGNFEISAIDISHDAAEPVAYVLRNSDTKITVASDMGIPNERLIDAARGSDVLAFEANHDVELLKTGSYPVFLKRRILSEVGHLSNTQSSEAIAEMSSENTRIVLTHLSEENNTPDTAYQAVTDYLNNRDIQYRSAECADQWKVSCYYTL